MARFCFDRQFIGGKYCAKTLIIPSTFKVYVLPTSADNKSNWHNTSLRNTLQRYQIFAPAFSVPDTVRVILKLQTNNKISSGLSLSNKDILNSLRSDVDNVGYSCSLSFIEYLSDLPSCVSWISGIGGGLHVGDSSPSSILSYLRRSSWSCVLEISLKSVIRRKFLVVMTVLNDIIS